MSVPAMVTAIQSAEVDPATAVRSMVNTLAAQRGMPSPWDSPTIALPAPESVEQIGEVHQLLLGGQHEKRGEQGSYYTPEPLAQFMARFTLDVQLARIGDVHPMDMLIVDPACGAGALLVHAARQATEHLIRIELDADPTDHLCRGLLPHLARDVIFGIDIDPVAVDLAKSALWLETDGAVQITWLDDNIIVGDTLAGDEPPRLRERQGRTWDEYPEVVA